MDFQSKKQSENGMHCCPNCDSILVQPVSWHEQFVTGLATDSILPEDFNASGGLA